MQSLYDQSTETRSEVRPGVPRDAVSPRWVVLLWGIATVLIGIYMVTRPGTTAISLVYFTGLYWLVGGFFDFVSTIFQRRQPRVWWHLFGAMVSMGAGLVIVMRPLIGTIIAASFFYYIVAFCAMVTGINNIFTGELLRTTGSSGRSWGRFVLGVLQVIIGLFWLWHPIAGAMALAPAVGVVVIIAGVSAIALSFRSGRVTTV